MISILDKPKLPCKQTNYRYRYRNPNFQNQIENLLKTITTATTTRFLHVVYVCIHVMRRNQNLKRKLKEHFTGRQNHLRCCNFLCKKQKQIYVKNREWKTLSPCPLSLRTAPIPMYSQIDVVIWMCCKRRITIIPSNTIPPPPQPLFPVLKIGEYNI